MTTYYEAGQLAALEKLGGDLIPPARLRFKRYQAQQAGGSPPVVGEGAVVPFVPKPPTAPTTPRRAPRAGDFTAAQFQQQLQEQAARVDQHILKLIEAARQKPLVSSERMDKIRSFKNMMARARSVAPPESPTPLQMLEGRMELLRDEMRQPVVAIENAKRLRDAKSAYGLYPKDEM
jgi:hypothetical protein